ncbi:MAG: type I-E CRISPR-associated protein Cas5/CasD [Nitrospinota bacterium]
MLFRLYGAMASWGDIAVGEYRPSFAHPSKSAVLGLLAAAKGVRREDEAVQREMAQCYGFAVRIDAAGNLMRDYHTIQVPPEAALKNHPGATRRDELNALKRYQLDYPKVSGTILSSRDYYCDALYTVCLWVRDKTARPFSLGDFEQALKTPGFVLYLGRKACPPSLQLEPQIKPAQNIKAAFDAAEFHDEFLNGLKMLKTKRYYWDSHPDAGLEPMQTFTRRDLPTSRRRWQFADRHEHYSGGDEGG